MVTVTSHCVNIWAVFPRVLSVFSRVLSLSVSFPPCVQCLVTVTTLTTLTRGGFVVWVGIARNAESYTRIQAYSPFLGSWAGPVD